MVCLKVLVVTVSIAMPGASLFSSAITPTNIISLTNGTRESLSLSDLTPNDKLSISAQMKAEDMLENQYFAHTSPDGVSPWSWFGQVGYKYRYAGENLAVYFTEAEDVHAGWLASPTHRANIVDTRYAEIGIGVAQGTYKGYPAVFVVQHFGYPSTTNVAAVEVDEIEPTIALAPVVTPQPSAVLAAKDDEAAPTLVISEASIIPEPGNETYNVELEVKDATTVTAHLGTESVALKNTENDTWSGSLAYNAASLTDGGEQLYVVASGEDEETVESLAIVAPQTETKDLYAFAKDDSSAKLFGVMKVDNLDDNVKTFYLYTMLFLGAVLFLTLLAKFRWDRMPLAGHSLAVIGLALLLTLF